MPATQQQEKFNAEESQRVAVLMAGGETSNPSEPEAIVKLRMMRRMIAAKGLRIVDALELPEIRKALDDQMQPVRHGGPDLQAAMEQAAALREELITRTRDVRNLMEERNELKENLLRRQRELDNFRKRVGNRGMVPPPAGAAPPITAPRVAPALMGRWWSIQVLFYFFGVLALAADGLVHLFG